MTSGTGGAARAVVYLIQLYRTMISPLRLPTCRFTPTCSQYAVDALSEYGVFRGARLAIVRLLKCGPWHRGGWDPIPEREPAAAAQVAEDAQPGCDGDRHSNGVPPKDVTTDFDRDRPAKRGECNASV